MNPTFTSMPAPDLSPIKQAIFSFHALIESEWESFSSRLLVKECQKGEYLIREGQVENYIYFLNQGSTRNYFLQDGKDFTVDFQFKGEFVTAYYSLITREPSTIYIELLENAQTVAIPFNFLRECYDSSHNVEKIGRLMAEYQYVKRLRKEMALLSETAEQRYAALLDKNPALISQVSVKHLSSYLGVQPESLSRIRKLRRGN
jgi:CRP/FNR family transcriptional regulator, anaerobic regulatory protein